LGSAAESWGYLKGGPLVGGMATTMSVHTPWRPAAATPSETELRTCTVVGLSYGAAKSFLPVIVPARAASARPIATHDVIAALDLKTKKVSGGEVMWVVVNGNNAEEAIVEEVTIREAEIC
jgi:hypothetical protein